MSVEVLSKRINLRERLSLSMGGASSSAGGVAVIEPKEKRRELWRVSISTSPLPVLLQCEPFCSASPPAPAVMN